MFGPVVLCPINRHPSETCIHICKSCKSVIPKSATYEPANKYRELGNVHLYSGQLDTHEHSRDSANSRPVKPATGSPHFTAASNNQPCRRRRCCCCDQHVSNHRAEWITSAAARPICMVLDSQAVSAPAAARYGPDPLTRTRAGPHPGPGRSSLIVCCMLYG